MGMSRRQWILILVAGALLAPVLVVVPRVLMGYGVTFYGSFESIHVGMDESRVIERLGQPNDRAADFRLGQREGFETEYAMAAASNSHHYLIWYKGIDVVYAVGVDANGKVTMKAVGGT